jgi:hypothetical protein
MRVGNTYLSGGLFFWAIVGTAILVGTLAKYVAICLAYFAYYAALGMFWAAYYVVRGIAWWVREGVRMVNRDSVSARRI